jgi:hypothetical protein
LGQRTDLGSRFIVFVYRKKGAKAMIFGWNPAGRTGASQFLCGTETVPELAGEDARYVVQLIAAYGAMQGQKGAGPLHVIIHLDPEFFVIRMEIAWYEAIADFAGDTSLGEPFTHSINEPPMK